MCIFNELQVGLVPLLQTLQQHPVLGPLQLQLPHLGMDESISGTRLFSNQTPRGACSPSSLLVMLPPTSREEVGPAL